mgnify:CR=1 FL=1
MYGKTFLSSENFGYYVLNTLVMMAVALSLSYLIGLFVKKQQHVKRDRKYPVSWNVLSVWCVCSHEHYGQKRPEGVSVSSCVLV